MDSMRIQCPQCRTVFLENLHLGKDLLHCPRCARDKRGDAYPAWLLHRRGHSFGPYSWAQLQNLADRAQIAPTDLISTLATGVPGDEQDDSSMPKLVPLSPQATLDDILAETIYAEPRISAAASRAGSSNVRPLLTLTMADFQIVRKLGAGGMGDVYLAEQHSMQRKVALKLLAPALAGQASYIQRFFREANVLARLNHPNIVQFFGVGEEKSIPFLAMEYVEGFSTATLMKRLGQPLAAGDALHIALKCAAALQYAHEHDVAHRDIKPENILITSLGKVKIGDLGLAKPLSEDLSLTETGLMLGSPKFMAPEQSRNAKHADHRSDIYSLGGVLYFFLTGRIPFDGATAMELVIAKELGTHWPARHWNAAVPPRLSFIIDKMLAVDPRHRFASCSQVMHELEELALAGEYLGFNPLHIVPLNELRPESADRCLVEILLIDDNNADVLLTQQALEEKNIASNLNVVVDGAEARAFLRKEGKYGLAPQPDIIILGRQLDAAGVKQILDTVADSPHFEKIPLVVLTSSPEMSARLEEQHIKVNLTVTKPEDLEHFEELVDSIQGICLTVVEQRP